MTTEKDSNIILINETIKYQPENDTFKQKVVQFIKFLGPAVLISVGYIDPGNWATDIQGGSTYGYSLIWVLIVSNMLAIVLQTLAARLGLVTGKSLAQQCANFYPKPVVYILWALAELAIAATDLAEVLGTAIGLNLCFGIPLLWGCCITAFDTLLLLVFQRFGHRFMEMIIFMLMSSICICFIIEVFIAKPDPIGIAMGIIPTLPAGSLATATGILGATIMPHNIYLHSGLMTSRKSTNLTITKRRCFFALLDAVMSLNVALFINAAILVVAAASFYGNMELNDIRQAAVLLSSLFGRSASIIFGIALLFAGQSSTITGTIAGEIVMNGFLKLKLKPWLRRLVTRSIAILPAVGVILIFGEASTSSLLIWSQVILSIQLPFAMIPLIRITSNDEMGRFKNNIIITIVGWFCVLFVIALNVWLVIDQMNENLVGASWYLWVLSITFVVLFFAFILYVTFIRITPKVSRIRFAHQTLPEKTEEAQEILSLNNSPTYYTLNNT